MSDKTQRAAFTFDGKVFTVGENGVSTVASVTFVAQIAFSQIQALLEAGVFARDDGTRAALEIALEALAPIAGMVRISGGPAELIDRSKLC